MKRPLFALALFAAVAGAQEDPGVSYHADVVPLLRARCIGCHNPTDKEVTTSFSTAAAVKGYKPIKTKITVPAGTSVDVK